MLLQRKKKRYGAVLILAMANGAHALGLGDSPHDSALSRPLQSDIAAYDQRTQPSSVTAVVKRPAVDTAPAVTTPSGVQSEPATQAQLPQPSPVAQTPATTLQTVAVAPWPASYRVHQNETLSQVADRFVTRYGVTRNQLMSALMDANPDAFFYRNMNGLKSGVDLILPLPEAVRERSVTAANTLVREQYVAWLNRHQPAPEIVSVNPRGSAPRPGLFQTLSTTLAKAFTNVLPDAGDVLSDQGIRLQRLLVETRLLVQAYAAKLDILRSRMTLYEARLQKLQNVFGGLLVEVDSNTVQTEPVASARTDSAFYRMSMLMSLLLVCGVGLFAILKRVFARSRNTTEVVPASPSHDTQRTSVERSTEPDLAKQMQSTDVFAEPVAETDTVRQAATTEVREIVVAPANAGSADRLLIEVEIMVQFEFLERGRQLLQAALRRESNPVYRIKLMELCHAMRDKETFLKHARILHDELTDDHAELWREAARMAATLCVDEFARVLAGEAAMDSAAGRRCVQKSAFLNDELITDQIRVLSHARTPTSERPKADTPIETDEFPTLSQFGSNAGDDGYLVEEATECEFQAATTEYLMPDELAPLTGGGETGKWDIMFKREQPERIPQRAPEATVEPPRLSDSGDRELGERPENTWRWIATTGGRDAGAVTGQRSGATENRTQPLAAAPREIPAESPSGQITNEVDALLKGGD